MFYELFISWRYLYHGRFSPAIKLAIVIGLALCFSGLGLFLWSGVKTTAIVIMLLGGIFTALSVLLALFSTFTAISVLGVAIGVSMLIWVLSVTSGFQEEFRRKVLGVNAHILVMKYGLDFSEYRKKMKTIEKVGGVVGTAPFVLNEMMIGKGARLSSGVLVKGVDPQRVGRVLDLPGQVVEPLHDGKPASLAALLTLSQSGPGGSPPGIVIGRELARKLDAHLGDTLRLLSPLSGLDIAGWSAIGEMPRSEDFRLNGIFDSGFNEFDKRLVYLHLKEAQHIQNQGDVVTGIDIKVNDVQRAPQLARRISATLGGSPYRTIDWSELNHSLFTALSIQKLFLELVIGIIIVVAAFNVLAALVMLVIRKTREVAILKSMGMPSRGIAGIFQCAGIIVWCIGTSLGLLWGYLGGLALRHYAFPLDPKVYNISQLPVKMDPWEFFFTALFALVVCLSATLYPAYRATRMNPVQGLRYE